MAVRLLVLGLVAALLMGSPSKKKTVGTARGENEDLVLEATIYVDPADPSDLARQLIILARDDDLRADYAERGHQRAARFSWEAGARRMDEIILSCL